jgi:hypothetical protein
MSRGAVITGTVFDVDGQPAQGVTVAPLVRRFDGTSGEARFIDLPLPVLPTDDRGVSASTASRPGSISSRRARPSRSPPRT